MSDQPPQDATPGGEGDRPKKRRRRRRRGKNKPGTGEAAAKPTPQGQADTAAPQGDAGTAPAERRDSGDGSKRSRKRSDGKERPAGSGGGYRGTNSKPGANTGPRSVGRGKPADAKASGGQAPDRPGSAAPKKKKKRRKPRTKQCVNCYTPCTTIHRVRLDYRKQWVFICDICWPSRCVDNPHYEFGGTWVSGRIVKPESQLRDEQRAKQKSSGKGHAPRHEQNNNASEKSPQHADEASPPPAEDASAVAVAEPPDTNPAAPPSEDATPPHETQE